MYVDGTRVHLRYGYERFGPPLPGEGPITGLFCYENAIGVIRTHNGLPQTYVLFDDADEWEVLRLH